MITILMAHYKQKVYVKEAIKSVLKQKSKKWNLIICDDCSPDSEFQYIKKIVKNHPQIKLIRNEENKGYIGTLKRMIDEAETEILGILDADDALTPNAVGAVLEAYRENPDIGFTYSRLYRCDSWLSPRRTKQSKQINNKDIFTMVWHYVDHFRTFKKSIYYKTGGYDERYIYAEDQDISYKLEEQAKGYYIPKPLYYYRVLVNSQAHDPVKRQRGVISHFQALFAAYYRRRGTEHPNLDLEALKARIGRLRRIPPIIFQPFHKEPLKYIFYYCKKVLYSPLARRIKKIFPGFEKLETAVGKLQWYLNEYKELLKDFYKLTKSKYTKQLKNQKPSFKPLSVSSVVCYGKKFAFVGIEKNASSYLFALVIKYDWGLEVEVVKSIVHILLGFQKDGEVRIANSQMKDLSDDFLRFAVYRDPVERVLSFYKNKIINNQEEKFMRMIERVPVEGTMEDKFVQFLKNNAKNYTVEYTDPHILPQKYFIDGAEIDYLVDMDDLDDFLKEKRGIEPDQKVNVSNLDLASFKDLFTEKQLAEIKELYWMDYALKDEYRDKLYTPKKLEAVV